MNRGDSVPNRSRLIAVVALVLLSWTGSPAQPAAPARAPLVSPRPLADVSVQFQEWRGKIVTYEEPLLTWSGDLHEIPGKSGTKGYLYPKEQAFLMPPEAESEPDLGVALNKTLEAYHQQTTGTRFQILTSKWGYHIVPLQVHDDHGALVPARSLLDAQIYIPSEERTLLEHLRAFGVAVLAATGTNLETVAFPTGQASQQARPERFTWGTEPKVARDALINLLSRSATRLSWLLYCQASSQADARFCALNLEAFGPVSTNSPQRLQ